MSFDGTYPQPDDSPKMADFSDCVKRRPKEAKEVCIIAGSVAHPAWDEGLKIFLAETPLLFQLRKRVPAPISCDEMTLETVRPIYKGLHDRGLAHDAQDALYQQRRYIP